jgi:class 3 adenylate cyclase
VLVRRERREPVPETGVNEGPAEDHVRSEYDLAVSPYTVLSRKRPQLLVVVRQSPSARGRQLFRATTMANLPSGTVTFLFTDVEGSAALWERDRQAMAAAVERHLALLDARSRWHGPRPPRPSHCRQGGRAI